MKKILLGAALVILLASCNAVKDKIVDSLTDGELTLNLQNLEDLGSDYKYEGWMIVDSKAKTTGTFTVDATGKMSSTKFNVNKEDLLAATDFVLTIEPNPDTDTAPSKVHILAGKFLVNQAALTADNEKAIGADLTTAKGGYILRTPTDGNDDMNEESGVWFLDPSGSSPAPSLTLPTLPEGWRYEGWAVIDGKPISTGVFAEGDTGRAADVDSNPFGGGVSDGPNYPGEDFLKNEPTGFTAFPADLKGQKIVVSVEPFPDNSPNPFSIKPLVHDVPSDAAVKTLLTMTPNVDKLPTGTATK